MPTRHSRLLAILGLAVTALVLWGALSGGTTDLSASGDVGKPTGSQATRVGSASGQPAVVIDPEDVVIAPRVQETIDRGESASVIVELGIDPIGSDPDRVAQVRAARDELLAKLPAGSWSQTQDVGMLPFVALSLDATGLDALRRTGAVTAVTEDEELFLPSAGTEEFATSDPSSINSTSTMGAVSAWASGWKGAGSTIAVVDTGVQSNHPYLTRNGSSKVIAEACFASPCASGSLMAVTDAPRTGAGGPCSPALSGCDHGTHVAGIAAGGTGASVPSGVAPDATLVSINVFSEYTSTTSSRIGASTSSILFALQWLDYNRARFPGLTAVNMSLGGSVKYSSYCDSGNPLKAAIDNLLVAGVSTVIAAGNSGWADGVASPACISSAVTVGAVDGVPDQTTYYSNDGPQLDLMAPGSSITSSILSSQMGVKSGTSMAAPAAAGAIAALRQATPEQTLSRLRATGYVVNASGVLVPSVRLADAVSAYPGPVRSVSVATDNGQARISWQAPLSSGSSALTRTTVTSVSDGSSCTTMTTNCTIHGLLNGSTASFVVRAESSSGVGAQVAVGPVVIAPAPTTTTTTTIVPSTPNIVAPPSTNSYRPISPVRIADTRSAASGGATVDGANVATGRVEAGGILTVPVVGRGGVPAQSVGAVALNVTIVNPTASGHLTVFPSDVVRPNSSNINFAPNQTVPNMVLSKLGADGSVSLFNANGSVDVIIDVVGWFLASSGDEALAPQRILETRSGVGMTTVDGAAQGIGAIGSGQTLSLPILGRGGVPNSGVSAVAVNVTAVEATGSSHLTVFPGGTSRPNASNLNVVRGQTVANMVIAKVGTDGSLSIYNNFGTMHLVVDVVGWFSTTSNFTSLNPARLVDSRASATVDGQEQNIGALSGGVTRSFVVGGRGGVPASGVRAVALNVTAVTPSASGHLIVFGSGMTTPLVSNLNFVPGQIVPNMVIAEVGADGKLSIANSAGSTPVVVDVVGWFS